MAMEDVQRALAAVRLEGERGHGDMMGRQQHFSAFMPAELRRLATLPHLAAVAGILEAEARRYDHYSELDVPARSRLLGEFFTLANRVVVVPSPPPPKPPVTVRVVTADEHVRTRRAEGASPSGGSPASGSAAAGASSGGRAPSAGGARRPRQESLPGSGVDKPDGQVATPPPPEQGTSVSVLAGVKPTVRQRLADAGLGTIERLLTLYPRSYLDFQDRTRIRDLQEGEACTFWGRIHRVSAFQPPSRPGLSIRTLWIQDGTGRVRYETFSQGRGQGRAGDEAWKTRHAIGTTVMISGRPTRDRRSGELVLRGGPQTAIELLGEDDSVDDHQSLHTGRIVPIYPSVEGMWPKQLRKLVHEALQHPAARVPDPLPPAVVRRLGLLARARALADVHFPSDPEARDAARRRMAFDELFLMQLALAVRRARFKQQEASVVIRARAGGKLEQMLARLPFTLTPAQQRVLEEIRADLASPEPMNRLVQGDVGAGKTVVALLAMLAVVDAGKQAVLMAPTEILAEQHHQSFCRLLEPLGVPVVLLLGKQGAADRRHMKSLLASGAAPLAVGTHALIQGDVAFQDLGLVVIDEQHRFGVHQRSALVAKGRQVELLTMTATPIPRTLTMTMHGDLDCSVLDMLPPGRKPIVTRWLRGRGARREALDMVRAQVAEGRQAYIVFPMVDASEKMDLRSATEEYERLSEGPLSDLKLGLLHGKMHADEKEQVAAAFRRGELQVLVATTVIEVGVDVPNASVMVIEHAERFGLSQLHQLRGRVGRGAAESWCLLLSDGQGEQVEARLGTIVQSQDGFFIAEQDLRLRGPGEILGSRQSGMEDFVHADLVQDTGLLEDAQREARALVADDPDLARYPLLKEQVEARYAEILGVWLAG
ncbi:MAG: ATP-dependent DNA helicase RecG [Candidatus Sericytochromatia bacterium]|nr:ATP-dependent DNA helicase RecG [Candidatus Tanganyikabacteria bacterium]